MICLTGEREMSVYVQAGENCRVELYYPWNGDPVKHASWKEVAHWKQWELDFPDQMVECETKKVLAVVSPLLSYVHAR